MKRTVLSWLLTIVSIILAYGQNSKELIFEGLYSNSLPENATIVMKSNDIEVDKNVEKEKLPTADTYLHTTVYIKRDKYLLKFHKYTSGDLVSADFVNIENNAKIMLLRLEWTFAGGFGTAGFSGKGESYFIVNRTTIQQLNDFRTEFSDEEYNLKGKVNFYYIDSTLFSSSIEERYYDSKPFTSVNIWNYGDYYDPKYQQQIQMLNFHNCVYDAAKNVLFRLNDTNINIRAKPDISSDAVGKLKGDELIKLIKIYPEIQNVNAVNGYWMNIKTGNLAGWIWSEYVEKLTDISVFGR